MKELLKLLQKHESRPIKITDFRDLSLSWKVAGGNHPLAHADLGTVMIDELQGYNLHNDELQWLIFKWTVGVMRKLMKLYSR